MTGLYVILTADVGLARAGVGDVTHSFTEQVSGRRRDPLADVVNSVACWGDIAFVRDEPGVLETI